MTGSVYASVDRAAAAVARLFALVGGVVLLALTAIVCVSVVGRELASSDFLGTGLDLRLARFGVGQVEGDFEMVELGVAFAIFSFLPWTQYSEAHARVDLFAPFYGPRLSALLDVAAQALMSAAALVIAWRLWLGMADKLQYGETSMILQFPVWQAYAAGLGGACGFVLVAVFSVWRAVRRVRGLPA